MTTNTSSIAVAISDIETRVQKALKTASVRLNPERLEHLKLLKQRADNLSSRGLLQRSTYASSSAADLEKQYLSNK